MNKTTLYIGLNDKESKRQEINTSEAIKILSNMLKDIGGATIYEATGIYTHENGDIIIENTLRVELIEVNQEMLKYKIGLIKQVLNQESVIMQQENVNTTIL